MSGKLNEIMNLFVGEVNTPAGRGNQERLQAEPSPGAGRRGFLDYPLDAAQNQLPG
jgi:hypothetical protein